MKKAQFFIGTIVLVALSTSIIAGSLTIPEQLKYNSFETDLNDYNNIIFVKNSIKDLFNNYFTDYWMLPYDYRTTIKVYNNFTLKGNLIKVQLDLPNDIHEESLILIDSDGDIVPFGIEWTDVSEKQGALYFQSSLNSMDNENYYLYYNDVSNSNKDNKYKEQMVIYNSSSEYIDIRTGLYSLRLNKSLGGALTNLNISGKGNVLNILEARLNCSGTIYSLSNSSNQEYAINDYNYFLEVAITGSRFTNTSYKIKEYFFPDRIIIKDFLTVGADSPCSSWEFFVDAKKDDLPNYIDSKENSYAPVPVMDQNGLDMGDWAEFYGDNYALGVLISNSSPYNYLSSTSSENILLLRAHNASLLSKGAYNNTITIIPMHNDSIKNNHLNYEVNALTSNDDLFNEKQELLNILKRYFTQANTYVTVTVDNARSIEQYNNRSNWYSNLTMRSSIRAFGPNFKTPLVISARFLKGFEPSSVVLVGSEGPLISQLSTDNYMNNSFSPLLNNSLVNNTILVLNLDGRDFNVSINKQVAGPLSAYAYYPNGTLINYYDINTDFYNIEFKDIKQSGFYNISFNGTDALFFANSSLPKMVIGLPAQVHAEELILPVNETTNNISISIEAFNNNARLIDFLNNTVASDNGSTLSLNADVVKCLDGCYYKLLLENASPAFISSSLNYACANALSCINPDEPRVDIVSYGLTSESGADMHYYYNVDTYSTNYSKNTDLKYSLKDYEVNNSYFSFDLDDLKFIVNNTDWSLGWTTCDPECTNGFNKIKFLETGPARVVLWANASPYTKYYFFFYYNASLFDVFIDSSREVTFGPDFKVGGSDTLYYDYLGSGSLSEGNTDNYINRVLLKGVNNYIRRKSLNNSFSVVFKPRDLSYNNSILVNDSTVRFKVYKPGFFRFLIDVDPNNYLYDLKQREWMFSLHYNITGLTYTLSEHS